MQFQWLRRFAAFGERGQKPQKFSDLQWIIREEFGEQTERLHWHALISGCPKGIVRSTTCLYMMGFWEGIGGGMARVRVYDPRQDGVDYMTKDLGHVDLSTGGANGYEVGKFSTYKGDDSLMLIPSKSLLSEWKRVANDNRGLRSCTLTRRTAAA